MERFASFNLPAVPIKVFIFLHLIFTSWALAYPWLPLSYIFCHLVLLVIGIWVIIQPSSYDANQMFLLGLAFALLNDCVLIGIWYDQELNDMSSKLRFAVAFAFLNLFLKPITAIFLLLGFQNVGGFEYSSWPQGNTSEQQQYQTIPGQQGHSTSPAS